RAAGPSSVSRGRLRLSRAPAWEKRVTRIEQSATLAVWATAALAVVFLLTPLIVTIAVSFGSSSVFTLPPPDWSLKWYARLPGTKGLAPSLMTSVQIAGLSTLIALVL